MYLNLNSNDLILLEKLGCYEVCTTQPTMKFEFLALDKAGKEAEWLQKFLEDIPNWSKPVPTICIHSDSQTTIRRAYKILCIMVNLDICNRDII